jgi:hypothetical protein
MELSIRLRHSATGEDNSPMRALNDRIPLCERPGTNAGATLDAAERCMMSAAIHECSAQSLRDGPSEAGIRQKLKLWRGEMTMAVLTTSILAASTGTAAGVSLVYLLMGGGLLGAVVIFAVAKML